MDKIIDPGFHLHRSCSQLSTHMMMQVQMKNVFNFFTFCSLQLSESSLLPLSTRHFVDEVEKGVKALEEKDAVQQLRDGGLGTPYDLLLSTIEVFFFTLLFSVQDFKSASVGFEKRREELKTSGKLEDPLAARQEKTGYPHDELFPGS